MRQVLWFVAVLSAAAHPAMSSEWTDCRITARASGTRFDPYPTLHAVVEDASGPQGADCPAKGSTLAFVPETRDYQSPLPRKLWPAKGHSFRMRYRYLDGICKGDGNSRPCRIEHYPAGW